MTVPSSPTAIVDISLESLMEISLRESDMPDADDIFSTPEMNEWMAELDAIFVKWKTDPFHSEFETLLAQLDVPVSADGNC